MDLYGTIYEAVKAAVAELVSEDTAGGAVKQNRFVQSGPYTPQAPVHGGDWRSSQGPPPANWYPWVPGTDHPVPSSYTDRRGMFWPEPAPWGNYPMPAGKETPMYPFPQRSTGGQRGNQRTGMHWVTGPVYEHGPGFIPDFGDWAEGHEDSGIPAVIGIPRTIPRKVIGGGHHGGY